MSDLLTLNEVAPLAGFIARAVKIPAIVDADTGFGGAENVGRTIYELERAGLAGCHLEDQEFPKRCGHLAGKRLVETDEMSAKIRAAVAAKRDRDFLVIARTDSRALEDFEGAVQRARTLTSRQARMRFFRKHCKRRKSSAISRGSESAAACEHDGVWQEPAAQRARARRARLPHGHFPAERLSRFDENDGRVFPRLARRAGSAKGWLDRMQTRKELYETLDYDPTRRAGRVRARAELKTSNAR